MTYFASMKKVVSLFFLLGLLFSLTLGVAWGVHLLWKIGSHQSFTALSLFDINAHGHAQVYGGTLLFLMGLCALRVPTLSYGLVSLFALGLSLGCLGLFLSHTPTLALTCILVGGALQAVALILFGRLLFPSIHSPWILFGILFAIA